MNDPQRILVAGDVHGDVHWWRKVCATAEYFSCDTIFQVGDFGWWPHVHPDYPAAACDLLDKHDVNAYWIDGNHENFDDLLAMPAGPDGFVVCGPRLKYVPRGTAWTWNEVRFLGLGGAYSIDKHHRMLGLSYWEQELITRADVERALNAGPADIMFAHDSPIMPPGLPDSYKNDATSRANREAVAAVAENAKPRVLYHGHYHHRYSKLWGSTFIEGLSRDGDPLSLVILDLDEFKTESDAETVEAGS